MSFKVVSSHHWEVGSTTVGGVRVNSSFRDMVITGAMGRYLRSYPHARFPDHEDLLRHPLLDDHHSRQGNSEAYPRGGVWFVYHVRLFLSCHVMGDLRFCFYFNIHSCMQLLTVKKVAEIRVPKLLQRRGSTSPNLIQDPIWQKIKK